MYRIFDDFYRVAVSPSMDLDLYLGDEKVYSQKLSGQYIERENNLAEVFLDDEPCVAIAMWGVGSGVYIHHIFSGQLKRQLTFRDGAFRVCIDHTGKSVLCGTSTGSLP